MVVLGADVKNFTIDADVKTRPRVANVKTVVRVYPICCGIQEPQTSSPPPPNLKKKHCSQKMTILLCFLKMFGCPVPNDKNTQKIHPPTLRRVRSRLPHRIPIRGMPEPRYCGLGMTSHVIREQTRVEAPTHRHDVWFTPHT